MTEVFQILFAPIVYAFVMCLIVSTVMHAFLSMLDFVWDAVRWFKAFMS